MIAPWSVDELRAGLRAEFLPVAGLKAHLVPSLASKLSPDEGPGHRVLPTVRQMKFVLWLWRSKDLSGRARIKWPDVNIRSRISMWIEAWKSG